ncbi:hypothetical protein [Leptolyngbya sp. FACHB-321]|uniref:hypothetical protein n=1 Tax=Leptolyngbya sp. FACHB-321 TaxID=2692807 RepID=UPI0018EF7E2D|nr:hypothetical protein [Leptolyngbya sp. FACHB-321]
MSLLVATLLLPLGCAKSPSDEALLKIKLYQNWELQPGDTIGDRKVLGGLGDIAVALDGNPV